MTKELTRRALLAGTGATILGAAACAVAQANQSRRESGPSQGVRRLAILVDPDRCASRDGCRACIDACHRAHAVPKLPDPQHEVKWITKAPFAAVFPEQIHPVLGEPRRQQPVLVLCNHCSSPPCARVCPTRATWKREDGIVAMDPHRCIGCRYCMAACPYGARSFNWENPPEPETPVAYPGRSRGVVEKCTLCVERIDNGQVPLCVETCQQLGTGALTYGDLANPDAQVSRILRTRRALRRRAELGTQPNVYYLI